MIRYNLIFIFLLIFASVMNQDIFADLFYSPSEYNKLKNEKIAVEIELNDLYKQKVNLENEIKGLNEQYDNDRFNLNNNINRLNLIIKDLNNRINKLRKEKKEEKTSADDRIKKLLKTLELFRKKSTTRERDLLNQNKKLQEDYEKQLKKMRETLAAEREKHLKELDAMRKEHDSKIAELMGKIKNLNQELSTVKRLTESQKRELERMSDQSKELEKQLSEEIKQGNIRLKKFHDKLIINIDNKISFASGSFKLKRAVMPALKKISEILIKYPENFIIVEGHTDNVPIRSKHLGVRDNWHLSTERALAVLNFLLKKTGLNPARFSAAGYSKYHPVVPNNSRKNKALNRRVDIVIKPRIKK